jgi:hypothetical protein
MLHISREVLRDVETPIHAITGTTCAHYSKVKFAGREVQACFMASCPAREA